MYMTTGIWPWIAAALTLAIYSFLYKDNPFYKIAEYIFVGLSAGYWASYMFWNYAKPNLFDPLFWPAAGAPPNYWNIIPIILGIMMFTQLFRADVLDGQVPAHLRAGRRPRPADHRDRRRRHHTPARRHLRSVPQVQLRRPSVSGTALGSIVLLVGVITDPDLLLLLLRAPGRLRHQRQDRRLLPDDLLRGILRLHRDGPYLAP